MKILLVHNEYGKRSGEEAVVDKMEAIFRGLGHEVARLTMSTAAARESLAGKFHAFAAGIHSPAGVRAMRDAIARHRPDVVNVHNLYPFIGPAALRECRKAGIPVIMTVHNFRLICPTGLFMRNGAPCELCLERGNEWGCVQHNCELSWPKSIAYAARNAVARLRRHYMECVDLFACITDFQRTKLAAAGFPKEKLLLIPNSIDLPAEEPAADAEGASDRTGKYVAFVGRLSREKGIDLIIEAARRNPHIPFRLAGAVAERALVADLPPNVELAGFVSGNALDDFYGNARFVVMASRCYEGFPMAILEAAQHGRPTVAPAHGGFVEIVGGGSPAQGGEVVDGAERSCGGSQEVGSEVSSGSEVGSQAGLLFAPGSAAELAAAVRRLWDDPRLTARLGANAHRNLRQNYSTQVIAHQWQKALDQCIVHSS